MRIERRLAQPWWLSAVVPFVSLGVAALVGAIVLAITGHDPITTYGRLVDSAFLADGALSATLVSATPLVFTGLAAAFAFRMQLFNIGGEGQLYFGVVGAMWIGLVLAGAPTAVQVPAMILAGAVWGAGWALIPALLRAFASTNEIITSLMLNFVAAFVINYLIFDSLSFWRDTSTPEARVFPQGKLLPNDATWPMLGLGGLTVPLGFLLAVALAAVAWILYTRTRFGFEAQVIGDSPRAARYAGMRTRRKIVAVMCLSGALAGMGGASQAGDFSHQLDPRGLIQSAYGFTGIVVAALGRYNPFSVALVGVLIGGLQNAGFALQSAEFPSGLVGMLSGLILFATLGGELFIRYRVRFPRLARRRVASEAAR